MVKKFHLKKKGIARAKFTLRQISVDIVGKGLPYFYIPILPREFFGMGCLTKNR